jgi:hypothetical protein
VQPVAIQASVFDLPFTGVVLRSHGGFCASPTRDFRVRVLPAKFKSFHSTIQAWYRHNLPTTHAQLVGSPTTKQHRILVGLSLAPKRWQQVIIVFSLKHPVTCRLLAGIQAGMDEEGPFRRPGLWFAWYRLIGPTPVGFLWSLGTDSSDGVSPESSFRYDC